MSAAPRAIAEDATIIGYPTTEGGDMVALREGSQCLDLLSRLAGNAW